MIKNIAVIGAGTMGNGIAHVFAQKDFNVSLVDISEDSLRLGMATIEKNLQRMVKKEEIDPSRVGQVLGNITTSTSLAEAVALARRRKTKKRQRPAPGNQHWSPDPLSIMK